MYRILVENVFENVCRNCSHSRGGADFCLMGYNASPLKETCTCTFQRNTWRRIPEDTTLCLKICHLNNIKMLW
jgi:hypothetical protein